MNSAQLNLVRDAASALLWRIEELVAAGSTFETAKEKAIRQASEAWKGFSPEIRDAVWTVAKSISPADMKKSVRRKQMDRNLQQIEINRGRKAGRIERLFYRLTGMVF